MKTILKLKYVVLIAMALLAFSCEGEDGEDGVNGLQGEQGIQGPAGQDGNDGADGINGKNGRDGKNGTNGINGVTSAISKRFNLSDWNDTSGVSRYDVRWNELTAQTIQSSGILFYVKSNKSFPVNVVPGRVRVRNFFARLEVEVLNGICRLTSLKSATSPNSEASGVYIPILSGDLDYLRIVIIKSTLSSKSKSKQQNPLDILKKKDVDVTDYYAVCDYYGLKY